MVSPVIYLVLKAVSILPYRIEDKNTEKKRNHFHLSINLKMDQTVVGENEHVIQRGCPRWAGIKIHSYLAPSLVFENDPGTAPPVHKVLSRV